MSGDALRDLGIELVEVPAGGFALHGGDADWLRAVFATLGYRVHVEAGAVYFPSLDAIQIQRIAKAAIAPDAILFDLDGVLADIAGRRQIANVPDVEALAQRFGIGVVTTCPRRLAEAVLERHGFAPFVQVVVGSDDGPCKPDPFPVQFALEQLGKQSAWMLGDNPSDMQAARGAGAVPIAVMPRGIGAESHMDRLRAAGAVRLVEGVGSLRELLG